MQTPLTIMSAHTVLRILPSSTSLINQSFAHTTQHVKEKDEADCNICGDSKLNDPIGIS